MLWQLAYQGGYIADPEHGAGSTHSWGVSVDATLVDDRGHPVRMPTDFDEFTPSAMMWYQGPDRLVKSHLALLQVAMAGNHFYGLRIEWWHFTTADWKKYVPHQAESHTGKSRVGSQKLRALSPKNQRKT
jgi:D-alanyl-D-alanine dipeptidase